MFHKAAQSLTRALLKAVGVTITQCPLNCKIYVSVAEQRSKVHLHGNQEKSHDYTFCSLGCVNRQLLSSGICQFFDGRGKACFLFKNSFFLLLFCI